MSFYSIILAAGEGKRMKSKYPKPLQKVCGKTFIEYVLSAVESADSKRNIVVTGHLADSIKKSLGNRAEYVYQSEPLGEIDAAFCGIQGIGVKEGTALVISADMPLITSSSLVEAYKTHTSEENCVTAITSDNSISNSGAFLIDLAAFNSLYTKLDGKRSLSHIADITDNIGIYNIDCQEAMDVNDRAELAIADKIINKRNTERIMKDGVTVLNPENVRIDSDVTVGCDTVIYPGTILEGSTSVGCDCIIGPNTKLTNCIVGDNTEIQSSVAVDCEIGNSTNVGPFAYIRPNSKIGDNIKVGDFVEVKNANIGNGTKIAHLTYVGDADVGERVNFGCGTVVVNYDGVHKNRTVIEDDCFIGCNTNLVSPVVVRKGGYTAAGSTITDEVPENALAIARARQVNKTSWQRPKK